MRKMEISVFSFKKMKVLLLYDGKHSIDLLGMLQNQNFQLFEEIIKLEDAATCTQDQLLEKQKLE